MRASKSRGVPSALIRPALWFCACNLLAAALTAQCTSPTQIPNQTISSGTYTFSDNNALQANSVTINGSASVTFLAGNCIHLGPGFRATAGTAPTTFHAWVETAPSVISASPTSGSGLSQQFTWTVSSPSGYGNLAQVFALFNTSVSGANACYIYYNRAANSLFLADNSGTAWTGGFTPGSSGFASNSYCTIYGSGSSVNPAGNQLALTVLVAFQPLFSGTKNNYLIAYDNAGLNTGWQQMGTWTITSSLSITTSSPLPSGTVGVPYSTTLAATGGTPGYTWALASGALPSGLSLSTNGTISGTPSSSGTSDFTVRVTDSASATTTKPLSITVGTGLTITTSSPLPSGTVGVPYNTTLAAAGGTPGYTWTLAGGSLPTGLSLASNGTISGTPSGAATSNFTVRVTDSVSATTTKALSLTIGSNLTITTSSPLPNGTVGVPYSTTLSATGGTPSYTWTVADGALPTGLSLSTGGTISGTPSGAAGTFTFTVRVTDSASASTTKAFSISVFTGLTVITNSPLPGGTVGVSYSATLAAGGGTPSYTWTLSAGALPSGLNLSTSGTISGTPSATGTFSFTVRVTDSLSATATQPLSLTVASSGLSITTTSLSSATSGVYYSAQLTATGGTQPYTWTIASGSLPTGLSLSTSGAISGTPSATGSFGFTARVTDSVSATATQPLALTVMPGSGASQVQTLEYIRVGGKVIAIENNTVGPALSCAAVNSGVVNTYFSSGTPTVIGGTPPYTFSLATGSLLGLSLNSSTGEVSGTPTAAGAFSIQVRDTNNLAAGNTCPFTIAPPALTISTTSLSGGYVGVAYSAVLSATGGTPAYTWSLVSGALPTGLSLFSSGTISGTPSSQGTFNFTVRVTDSASATATQPLSITVTPAPYANLYISSSSFYTNNGYTLWLYTNQPNTWFTMCAIFPSGSQSCTPNWGRTDANGYWTSTGSFPPGNAGYWREWVVFPNVTSNTIAFTVYDYANLYISSGFHVGNQWTLSLYTSIPNTWFTICAIFPGGGQSCTPNWGYTDAYGNWTSTGWFSAGDVGSWQEWVVFPTATSNTINFTVSP